MPTMFRVWLEAITVELRRGNPKKEGLMTIKCGNTDCKEHTIAGRGGHNCREWVVNRPHKCGFTEAPAPPQGSPSKSSDVVSCHDCGIPYSELGLDMVLPDQQWRKIAPGCGVLCPNCICKRAAKINGTVVLAWIDQIDYSIGS